MALLWLAQPWASKSTTTWREAHARSKTISITKLKVDDTREITETQNTIFEEFRDPDVVDTGAYGDTKKGGIDTRLGMAKGLEPDAKRFSCSPEATFLPALNRDAVTISTWPPAHLATNNM